ncbi:2-hydroxyacid dehydrogenase [Pelosinus sp. IPA-1]|uniref:2-hydroxyacid dehydrogenase n=1 Tax=Pelosinus sp. IPA-1 TaxID=3029569 RepID=UPI0024361EAD|nr:2-hydroxyacid dehydrogenase [Pelosinus sp. IPA-1]GMB00065.1 2-hydroxyacid dehydrogenase [Pelosinus sp. IPA-1]
MTVTVIYFEKVSTEIHKMIETYKEVTTEIVYWHDLNDSQKEHLLSRAHYFITAATPITRSMIEKAPNLKLIQKTGSGVDNIDLEAAKERGILVASTPGANSSSVAEMTIGMILCLYRKLHFLDQETKQGKWLMWEHRPFMFEMKGKTHGIVGMGHIGKRVAQLSKGFGTDVIYFNRNRLSIEEETRLGISYTSFTELLRISDIVSLHIPLLPETRNLIGETELNLMKPNAILINVARGNIIDEKGLVQALKTGNLLGVGMDTWSSEPMQADNPLLRFTNVLATPHVGGGTRDVLENVLRLSFENIEKVEKAKMPNNLV